MITPLEIPAGLANHPDYEVLAELGRGGMGVVYKARHRGLNRFEVIKVLNAAMLERPNALARFRDEMTNAASLSHPHIVTVYGRIEREGMLAIVMEFLEGADLGGYVRRKGPLSVMHACHYAKQAAMGLQYAHGRRVVHRDIKPENLFLTIEGTTHTVKILDFGLAKVTSEKLPEEQLTVAGLMLGSPLDISPEQIVDARSADIRSDLYSLGCTMYFLLTGRPPFAGSNMIEILDGHRFTRPAPLRSLRSDIPPALEELILKMLEKDPSRRPQLPQDVSKALSPHIKAAPKSPASLVPGTPPRLPGDASTLNNALDPTRGQAGDPNGEDDLLEPDEPMPPRVETKPRPDSRKSAPLPPPLPDERPSPKESRERTSPRERENSRPPGGRRRPRRAREGDEERRSFNPFRIFLSGWFWCPPLVIGAIFGFYFLYVSIQETRKSATTAPGKKVSDAGPTVTVAEQKKLQEEELAMLGRVAAGDGSRQLLLDNAPQRLPEWKRLAALEDPIAQLIIGRCHIERIGGLVDVDEGYRLLLKSANAGNTNAMNSVGLCLADGEGVVKNPAEACRWYRQSAEKENHAGMYLLAKCLERGSGVGRDLQDAVRWYRSSAALGNSQAMYELGLSHQHGIGVEKSPATAFDWYLRAAEKGNSVAMNDTGWCYDTGYSVSVNRPKAYEWFRKSVEKGNAIAMSNLGLYYENGFHVEKNIQEALNWYRRSASQGNSNGMNRLAVCLENGTGVDPDHKEAFRLYSKAADLGLPAAMRNLARCHQSGIGVPVNKAKADEWLAKAKKADPS